MKKKILCLAMVAVMAVGIHTTAFAETLQGGSDWKVEFNGSKMSSNFTSADMKKNIFQLQPGDTMELQVEVRPNFYSDEINRMLALKKKLAGRLQSVLGLGVNVKLVEPRSIERSVGKAKRVIDNRKI